MNTDLLTNVTKKYLKQSHANFKVGDTVEVSNIIRDGDKQRVQKFTGLVIAINGSGISKTFTVRKISYGIGVEKIFPIHSPNVADIQVVKYGKARRSKLYFLRERVGKMALKVGAGSEPTDQTVEVYAEEPVKEAPKAEATEAENDTAPAAEAEATDTEAKAAE